MGVLFAAGGSPGLQSCPLFLPDAKGSSDAAYEHIFSAENVVVCIYSFLFLCILVFCHGYQVPWNWNYK